MFCHGTPWSSLLWEPFADALSEDHSVYLWDMPRYPEIDIPVKVIWGRKDSWLPLDQGSRLAELMTGAELEIIDAAGHLIQYDAPVHLATALHRWLSRKR